MSDRTLFGATGPLGREPVITLLGAATVLLDAGIVLANAFDWVSLTDAQTAAIVGCVTAVTTVFGGVLRQQVYSPASHAVATHPGPIVPDPPPEARGG
jgi:hypothetical protein